ncbi:hypothetical protein NMG60_11005263 [Bertholletia excelsa]
MRSSRIPEKYTMMKRTIPSLVDLCVQTAIDNIRYLGDVGETDLHLLERILPHCTVEQLMHVENSTEGRDLSPVTDKLWKKFYESQFGAKSVNLVIERMKQKRVSFKWKQLYEAKMKDFEEAQQKSFDRIRELYKKENARKQSKQVQFCTKVPPSSNKRSFFGGGPSGNLGNTKSNIMKKAKLQFLNSQEMTNLAVMKKSSLQRSQESASSFSRPAGFLGRDSASTAKHAKSMGRTFQKTL